MEVSPELQELYPRIIDVWGEWMSPEAFEPFLPYMTVKPQGSPQGKDNVYGYGLPAGNLIAQAFQQQQAIDVGGMITMAISVGMMGMMMGVMSKALR